MINQSGLKTCRVFTQHCRMFNEAKIDSFYLQFMEGHTVVDLYIYSHPEFISCCQLFMHFFIPTSWDLRAILTLWLGCGCDNKFRV